jgi:hypothetical protein
LHQHIVLLGGFSANEYLYEQIKKDFSAEHNDCVLRPADLENAAAQGAVMARLSFTQTSTQMYFLETMALFESGSDPEYYRQASLDGQDRCLYTWGAVVPIETSFSPYYTVSFPMQKLVTPRDPLIFEDKI